MTTKPASRSASRNIGNLNESEAPPDRRAERRSARQAQSRIEILNAAERVFGEDGMRGGSLRKIAELSGFSPAAIYLFFANKQDLWSETLTRRANEWNDIVRKAVEGDSTPLDKLHRIVDLAIVFFGERPQFRLLLRHIRGWTAITGADLIEFPDDVHERYLETLMCLARIVHDGQGIGQIREGSELSIAHLYSILTYEFILFEGTPDSSNLGALTATQFHSLIDGALRSSTLENSSQWSDNLADS
jgi:AcrR family transcriptional regulator